MARKPTFQFSIDPAPDAELAEVGRLLFAGEIDFVLGAAQLEQLPPGDRLEICFAGRSNVGKSSLINRLTNRKALARASNTPGRTQQLNYFDVGGRLYMVDLPGYGYAEAPKSVVDAWQDVLKAYLRGRASLRRVFLLIDGRHGPKKADEKIMSLLDAAAVAFQVVVTKADKPKKGELEASIAKTAESLQAHPTAYPEILVTSSESGRGAESVRAAVAQLLAEG
ncbi:MAG: ribosome biogenesis GTP-binding protein YihA/YsxC [Neomegalonema sp.]|nr:ribosome biogenesis GTP-binding protein YihA/YsxC [Neomegalonema sp.]